MTTAPDLRPLATAAADYRQAVARIEDAAVAAESAWKLLPVALDSPGTRLAAGRFVDPARRLATGLLDSADALHGALLTTTEAECASVIAAIDGGEAGSVALPAPDLQAPLGSKTVRPASFAVPVAPTWGLPDLGGAVIDGATAAGAATAAGLLGVLGLVLSLGGSSDGAAAKPHDNRKPRKGIDEVRVTPYTPCNPWEHGPGCQEKHLTVEKPGDEPFTGDKVKGGEPPGEMPGTEPDWTMEATRKGDGWIYRAPDGREMRVMKPDADDRYPNGYVAFTNKAGQRIDLYWKTHLPKTSDEVHITRNTDGSFPIPSGWSK